MIMSVTTKEKDWTLPGVKLTHEEFMDGIKKAEEGSFYTLEEMKDIRSSRRRIKL